MQRAFWDTNGFSSVARRRSQRWPANWAISTRCFRAMNRRTRFARRCAENPCRRKTRPAYPQQTVDRIRWKAPSPLLRHHFGIPAQTIDPTVEGIAQIAEAGVLDVISLGADQDAQENFFRPARQDPRSKGAGGVPFRTEEDLLRLYEASRRGNYPLMRSYSGTADHLRYADLLVRTIHNAWCATSLFWFNAMDGRGPSPLEQSIREHQDLDALAW